MSRKNLNNLHPQIQPDFRTVIYNISAACYEGSKRNIQNTSRRSWGALLPGPPAGATPAGSGLRCPFLWHCSSRDPAALMTQHRTQALAWQKESGEQVRAEDGRHGKFIFSLQISACSYNQTSHQKAVTVSLAIWCAWSLKGLLYILSLYKILYNMQFWPLKAILTLKYQTSTLQLNSYRACATTSASLPFPFSLCCHSCANIVVCGNTPWRSSGNLIYQIFARVLPKKCAEWLLSGIEPWFTAWSQEHVCQHTWGSQCAIAWQETMDAAIFSEGTAAKHRNLLIITGCLA